jgi:hypothetical protein
MALFGRLAMLGAAGAAAAWFLKQRQDSGESSYAAGPGAESASTGVVEPEQVGDAAAAGAGTSETQADSPAGSDSTRMSDVVVPDTSTDPLVREQENAAAAEAGAIGGTPETVQSGDDPGKEPLDPAMKPVIEASGEEHETLVEDDAARGVSREREGSDQPAP